MSSLKKTNISCYPITRLFVLVFLLVSGLYLAQANGNDNKEKEDQISREQLSYKLKLGWFTIGSGKVTIHRNVEKINGKNRHQVEVYAETLGLGNWLGSLDDSYITIVEEDEMKVIRSEKDVTVGKSRWKQWTHYDYDSMKVNVKVKDHRRDDPDRNWDVEITENTYGILGTFMHLASRNWNSYQIGDSLMVKTFYEKKLYDLGLEYRGKENIDFDGNDVEVYRLHLLLPYNDKVKKDRPIIVWLTADDRQYPIRIQTKLPFLGKGRVELIEMNGQDPYFD